MDTGVALSVALFCLFWVVFGLVMFWFYAFSPIFHWYINSNGEPVTAVILEKKNDGWGWYTGRLGESLMFQPVRVKLEVHPKGGATYVAYDRFNARPRELYQLNPGVELPVTI